MRIHKKNLMNSVAARCLGIMNAEESTAGDGGGTQGGGGNNQAGNTGDSGTNNGGTQNNAGGEFDPASFWKDPPTEQNRSGNGNSTESGSGGGDQNKGNPDADAFKKQLNEITYNPVFDDNIVKDLAEGKLESVNAAIGERLKTATQQSVLMSAQLMEKMAPMILQRVESMIQEKLGNRDSEQSLSKEFSSYNDPATRPVIDNIFNRAMTLTKNDRPAAIKMTRDMLKLTAQNTGKDLGLNQPPEDPMGGGLSESSKSLVDELLGR